MNLDLSRQALLYGYGEQLHGSHIDDFKLLADRVAEFSVIFMELPISLQDSVENYLKTSSLDAALSSFISGAEREGKYIRQSLLIIFDAAKSAQIPIICIDSSKIPTQEYKHKSTVGYYFLKSGSRDEDMYLNILKHLKKGRYLLICGDGHLTGDVHPRTGQPTLGKYLRDYLSNNFRMINTGTAPERSGAVG